MEENVKQETKTKHCGCTALLGALVIVFAWWQVRGGAIVLTMLGAVILLKELAGKCCCHGSTCEPRTTP